MVCIFLLACTCIINFKQSIAVFSIAVIVMENVQYQLIRVNQMIVQCIIIILQLWLDPFLLRLIYDLVMRSNIISWSLHFSEGWLNLITISTVTVLSAKHWGESWTCWLWVYAPNVALLLGPNHFNLWWYKMLHNLWVKWSTCLNVRTITLGVINDFLNMTMHFISISGWKTSGHCVRFAGKIGKVLILWFSIATDISIIQHSLL